MWVPRLRKKFLVSVVLRCAQKKIDSDNAHKSFGFHINIKW